MEYDRTDLREFQRLKFMITVRITLYKDKLDGTVDYAEPLFYPRNQFVLFDLNEIDDRFNFCANLRGYRNVDAQWFWMDRGSCRIYANYHFDISTLEGRLVYRTTEIHKLQKTCIKMYMYTVCV